MYLFILRYAICWESAYVPQYQPAQEIQFWGTVAAVLIVGGTIAEDVITGGGGIADDAASFYLAYRLMFGL